jgi:hypothetical protein
MLFAVVLIRELRWEFGLIIVVAVVVLAEYFDQNDDARKLVLAGKNLLIPVYNFFVGVVLVFCYNDLIVSVIFYGSCDPFFERLDERLENLTKPFGRLSKTRPLSFYSNHVTLRDYLSPGRACPRRF